MLLIIFLFLILIICLLLQKYIHVLSRPMVIAQMHNTVWTNVYMDTAVNEVQYRLRFSTHALGITLWRPNRHTPIKIK